jgi:hypothetical protein
MADVRACLSRAPRQAAGNEALTERDDVEGALTHYTRGLALLRYFSARPSLRDCVAALFSRSRGLRPAPLLTRCRRDRGARAARAQPRHLPRRTRSE